MLKVVAGSRSPQGGSHMVGGCRRLHVHSQPCKTCRGGQLGDVSAAISIVGLA